MTLDARRIALQGIGYGALFVALQGFAPAVSVPPDELTTIEIPRASGGALLSWHLARQTARRRRIDEDEALLLAVLK